jgi:hypothetical protein
VTRDTILALMDAYATEARIWHLCAANWKLQDGTGTAWALVAGKMAQQAAHHAHAAYPDLLSEDADACPVCGRVGCEAAPYCGMVKGDTDGDA